VRARHALAALVCAAIASCAAEQPQNAVAPLREAPLAGTALPAGGEWPTRDWWQRYQDPTLDQLVTAALADSPTLAAAHARFDSARESVRLAAAAVGAHLDASAQVVRQRLSDNGLIPPQFLGFNWYNQADLGLAASYTFDWWGKQRASVEAATNEARAAAADRTAAALVLSGSVVDAYFGWQTDQARIALVQDRIATLTRFGAIADARVHANIDDGDEHNKAAADLAAARGQLASLQGSAQLRLLALAALTGHAAAQLPALAAKPLPILPATLPDRVGLDLLGRRPDIAASRARVEAAQRRRHVAAAQYYPDISIHALAGLQSIDMSQLLRAGSAVPQVGIAIHLPLFDNGARAAQLHMADAEISAAIATYNEAIISAARDVASSVIAGEQANSEHVQQLAQLQAGVSLEQSAAARARQGLTDLRPQLTVHNAVLVQRDALAQIDAARLSADIALQRALGGGFEDSPSNSDSTSKP
jgi:multidrug efflux system outer membrane protein